MDSKVQLKEKELEGGWQEWVQAGEDIVWMEEGVREEMWETGKREMEGDPILQAEAGHRMVIDWAIKHWKNSLEKIHL